MKEQGPLTDSLPDGVELSIWELQEMATRQQQQIESQQQILVAKEQRLRYLKHQEARSHQVAAENERLRRLKERVEAQELKLRKLRALRGQVDQDKISNGALTSDLDSIRALFNEKEKELSLAVAKVEELTRQLEELKKNGRTKETQPPTSAALELEKLRRERLFRNKLKEQQNSQISQQRDALNQRQQEINSIDKRITELQDRLHRKRLLNQQLANQIQQNNNNNNNNTNNKQINAGLLRTANSASGLITSYQGQYQKQNVNVAAVEPYHHVPSGYYQHSSGEIIKQNVEELKKNTYQQQKQIKQTKLEQNKINEQEKYKQEENKTKEDKKADNKYDDSLAEFSATKCDPKYQTLPYNTKFSGVNKTYQNDKEDNSHSQNNYCHGVQQDFVKNTGIVNPTIGFQNGNQKQLMTVHSTPIPAPSLNNASKIPVHLNPRVYGQQNLGSRGQPVGGSSLSSSTSSLATVSSSSSSNQTKTNYNHQQKTSNIQQTPSVHHPTANSYQQSSNTNQQQQHFLQKPVSKIPSQKPISSVAPTNIIQKPLRNFVSSNGTTCDKPSPIYQTSSTKIPLLQPQVLSSTPQGVLKESKGELSPPVSTSTPLGTPESIDSRIGKPVLPPKPAVPVKPTPPPPPRQTPITEPPQTSPNIDHKPNYPECKGYVEITTESIDQALNKGSVNINVRLGEEKKDEVPFENTRTPTPPPPPPPTTEPPDDRKETDRISQSLNSVGNVHITLNRRIEMPPEFLFPENESLPADLVKSSNRLEDTKKDSSNDEADRVAQSEVIDFGFNKEDNDNNEDLENMKNNNNNNQDNSGETLSQQIVRRVKKGNLKQTNNKVNSSRRVSFDPLALLLDASLEGELELVKKTAGQVSNPSAANDEGITALHNAICAGHLDIVTFLVEFGCDVNAQDSDGWTPLHCAASCNNLAMVKFLVEHGACIFATTLSDHETAAEKCEEDEEGFDGCSEYLYSVQEKLGILNGGVVYAVYDYTAHNSDELSFSEGDRLVVLRKGDEFEREWWWSRVQDREGYTPRNLLGLYPRVHPSNKTE